LNTGDGSKLVVPSDIPGTGNITINYTWQYKRGGYGAAGVPSYVPPGENAVVELQGDDTYTGTTTVAQGTLLRNSTHTGAGNYTVQAAQTLYPGQAYEEQIPAGKLGGNGTITFASGKKLTVAGILSPGMSIGTLRVVGDAVYSGTAGVFEVDVGPLNMSDLLDVSGLFDLNGSDGTAEAELRVLNPEEGTFTIANYGTLGGTFASVTGVGGFLYDINYGSGSGDHIVLTLLALPEPATLGLMALGGAALVVVRRRKRR
jgi:autotransporter-associated beta strand protein